MVGRVPSKSCRDSFADKDQLEGSQALPMVIERFLDDHDDALNACLDTSKALNGLVSAGARAAHARMRAYQKKRIFLTDGDSKKKDSSRTDNRDGKRPLCLCAHRQRRGFRMPWPPL